MWQKARERICDVLGLVSCVVAKSERERARGGDNGKFLREKCTRYRLNTCRVRRRLKQRMRGLDNVLRTGFRSDDQLLSMSSLLLLLPVQQLLLLR